jgi:diadenylate cyclase
LTALRLVAPGTPLRDGIERVMQARMGALIVVGAGPEVLTVCSGGFPFGPHYQSVALLLGTVRRWASHFS